MNRSNTASYDLFKLIVALILAAILILMLLRGCATNPAAPVVVANTITATAVALQPTTVVVTPATSAPIVEARPTPTALPPTATNTPESTAPTATATPEAAQPIEVTPAAETATSVPVYASCNTTAPSKLKVGDKARALRRLNMRSQPDIKASILQVNPTDRQVDIISGPVCQPMGAHAYQWWQIRLANGMEGWSAETPLNEGGYFLEPVK